MKTQTFYNHDSHWSSSWLRDSVTFLIFLYLSSHGEALVEVKERLYGLPYWDRCQCSSEDVPTLCLKELSIFLSLVPRHRFIIAYLTNSTDR